MKSLRKPRSFPLSSYFQEINILYSSPHHTLPTPPQHAPVRPRAPPPPQTPKLLTPIHCIIFLAVIVFTRHLCCFFIFCSGVVIAEGILGNDKIFENHGNISLQNVFTLNIIIQEILLYIIFRFFFCLVKSNALLTKIRQFYNSNTTSFQLTILSSSIL